MVEYDGADDFAEYDEMVTVQQVSAP